MATIKSGNWSFKEPGKDIPEGSIITGGNFSQLVPGTIILANKKLTITGGNFVNVKKDPNWIIKGGNWTQVTRCSHLHPGWVERGLKVCAEDCEHRSASPEWHETDDPDEFRKEKPELSIGDTEVVNDTDADGITKQTYKYRKYVYRDKVQ